MNKFMALHPDIFFGTQLFFASLIGISSTSAFSQTWCTPPTCSPFPCAGINTYGSTSPVITNVTFNTINRTTTTSQKELYVNTGISTTVTKGQAYNFSMTYSMDPPVCPTHELRVWIDWNIDLDFADAGELALTASNQNSGTYSGTITVPTSAATGTTRMRVALKMTTGCGHTAPDPCLVTDGASVGWHGEVEDYTIIVMPPSGVVEYDVTNSVNIFPNPMTTSAAVEIKSNVTLKNAEFVLYDAIGKEAAKISVADGSKSFSFDRKNLAGGFYLYKLFSEGKVIGTGKLQVD
ncbi:MAG: T9SS type A sorting domain-containing protein [Bacteroidetes bacterium]|nr:T9SS type A sorting domain-containing protein [Bacteroidota bacterium]